METQLPSQKGGTYSPQFAALVYFGQTVAWIKMPLGMEVGLGPGDIVRWGLGSPMERGTAPQFSAHICCGQMTGWIKMTAGTEVGLGLRDIVLDGDQLPSPKGHSPQFSANGWMD